MTKVIVTIMDYFSARNLSLEGTDVQSCIATHADTVLASVAAKSIVLNADTQRIVALRIIREMLPSMYPVSLAEPLRLSRHGIFGLFS
jgi:hypothetical protein